MPRKFFFKHANRVWITSASSGSPALLGSGLRGRVYAGRAMFEGAPHSPAATPKHPDRKRVMKRVAIQVFSTPLSHAHARSYQNVINRLMDAKVRIPKMGMTRLSAGSKKDQWVLVSQLFGSTEKRTKVIQTRLEDLPSAAARKDAAVELAKVAAAGFIPSPSFISRFVREKSRVIPLNLDEIVNLTSDGTIIPVSPKERASLLVRNVRRLATSSRELRLLLTATRNVLRKNRVLLDAFDSAFSLSSD